jgi:hypothetical protein
MKNTVESHLEKKKRAYEPPVFKRVRLEIKTSVLAACTLSVPVSPEDNEFGSCQAPFTGCLGTS